MRSDKQIRATISGIGKRQKTLKHDIHTAAVEVAGHAHQHGRATLAQELFLATAGQDRHALVGWFHHYTCVRLDADGKATINKKARADFDGTGDELIADLTENATPWYELVKDLSGVARDVDPAKSLRALAKKVNKAPEKGLDVKINRSDLEDALRELMIALDNASGEAAGELENTDTALARELRMVA